MVLLGLTVSFALLAPRWQRSRIEINQTGGSPTSTSEGASQVFVSELYQFGVQAPGGWVMNAQQGDTSSPVTIQSADGQVYLRFYPHGDATRNLSLGSSRSVSVGHYRTLRYYQEGEFCAYQYVDPPTRSWKAPNRSLGIAGNYIEVPCREDEAVRGILTTMQFLDASYWRKYCSNYLRLSFLHPAHYGSVRLTIGEAERGTKLIGKFSRTNVLVFTGISTDFMAGIEPGPGESRGFVVHDGLVYEDHGATNLRAVTDPRFIDSPAGARVVLFRPAPTAESRPADGELRGLVNIDHAEYAGLAFRSTGSGLDQVVFERVLASLDVGRGCSE